MLIAFDLFIGWLDSKRITKKINNVLTDNEDKFQAILDNELVQEDIARFRAGVKLEKGFQLYFVIKLFIGLVQCHLKAAKS